MSNYALAREILGQDFISPEEVMKSYKKIVYTDGQMSKFNETIPSQEVLEWCRDNNYMLVAGPSYSMSLLEIRRIKYDYFYSKEGEICEGYDYFKNDKVETRWYMVCKDIVTESIFKNWEEQQCLLSEIEAIPNVSELVWAITTYKSVRDIYLFRRIYVRTSSLASVGGRILVGCFDEDGMDIESYLDCDPGRGTIGLSVIRR